MANHPYLDLINQEAKRAEDDLSAFRVRALAVVTTSSGVITVLTSVATLAASKAEKEAGLSGWVLGLIGAGLLSLVLAAALALLANAPGEVDRPSGAYLADITAPPEDGSDSGWSIASEQHERRAASATVKYLVSVRQVGSRAARFLQWAIGCQVAGISLAAIAGFVALRTM